ncbi:hypothetical protein [Nitrosomonas sp. Nm58]|uniref:hypothetical protein n=1 Tax=Nitrosomonas sp. Nm58 TaxID=200126 RepID=UPI000898C670|nr:hypothetical protein [Nitrosomonas sp. Nm58]SDZ00588.1 hypothetical protein SAMN05421754_104122 [Nitrosomonas sp. Nm58]
MAIYAVGANYDGNDVSDEFIDNNIAGPGWSITDAPELHQFVRSLKVGDIVYIKSYSPGSSDIIVKGIGIIMDDQVVTNNSLVAAGRNIKWVVTDSFRISKPTEKYNVRLNTMYEEFHPVVQSQILAKLF